jgi:glyceraldehyde 3-phosphate dehydrogenase
MNNTTLTSKVSFQVDRRRAGVELIKIISDLWYDKSIEMVLFKINCLIKRERYYQFTSICRRICGQASPFFDSVEIARAIWELDLPPAS